jgi:hypothetical protein
MGKIGDLWVKLGLKSDDYKKGMDNAKKETEGFKGSLGKMKAGALAVWAAIGAAVTKFAQDLIASTNRMGDAWAVFTSQSKAAWDTFLSAISAWDFNNFFGRMREATAAAAEYAKALDSEFEADNSVRLQKAAMAAENAALKVLMQDQTKSYDERIKAAQQYLANIEPIYAQIEAQAKKMADANFGKWLAGSGLGDTEQVRADLRKLIVEIGKNDELVANLSYLVENRARYSSTLSTLRSGNVAERARGPLEKFKREYEAMQAWAKQYGAAGGYGTSLYEMFRVYANMRGDKDTKPLVDALVRADEAGSLYNDQTREIQSVMNGLVKQQTAEAIKAATEAAANSPEALLKSAVDDIIANIDKDLEALEDIEIKLPEIDTTALDEGEAKLQEFVDNWRREQEEVAMLNAMLSDSIVASLSGGAQAFTDMLFGLEGADASSILAALMQPFADTAVQLGEMLLAQGIAVTAFKESLSKLDGPPAIAAGLALIAIGSAMRSGIQALANRGGGSTATASVGDAGGSAAAPYMTELTIYVEGRLDGGDIVLSGKKTTDAWGR